MMKKFCCSVALMMPKTAAKVTVVVAMMMQERFFRNSVVWNRFGMKRKTIMLSTMAMTM